MIIPSSSYFPNRPKQFPSHPEQFPHTSEPFLRFNYSRLLWDITSGFYPAVITGRAGSGKSELAKAIIAQTPHPVLVTAPTGQAALQIPGAMTNHAVFGLRPTVAFPNQRIRLKPEQEEFLRSIQTWIMDECFMVRSDIFEAINQILQTVRGNSLPLGGVRLIAVGDPWQLPPMADELEADCISQFQPYFSGDSSSFISTRTMERLFHNLEVFELVGSYRQGLSAYLDLLDRTRFGKTVNSDIDLLNTRKVAQNIDGVPLLTTTRKARDIHNNSCIAQLPTQRFVSIPEIKWSQGEIPDPALLEGYPANSHLPLKIGMKINFNKNDPARRWVNGTAGELVDIAVDYWGAPSMLTVHIPSPICPMTVHVFREPFSIFLPSFNKETNQGYSREVAQVVQFPIEIGYATTIHRSQGGSIGSAMLHLGKGAFAAGQLYVALSRIRSIENLWLATRVKLTDVIVSKEALWFYLIMEDRIQMVFPD